MALTNQPVRFRADFDVDLIDVMGTDARIVAAARVSTVGSKADDEDAPGLINFLMKNRHGTPFEHCVMQFRVCAPIFVWREHHRHRIASYNEESGRYKQLEPVFYKPSSTRPLQQQGKPGHYEYVQGDRDQFVAVQDALSDNSAEAYAQYEALLDKGIAKEVARMVLPVNIYSTCYVTMNLRALMNFLSLRLKSEGSFFPSFPQREIEMVAERYFEHFWRAFPVTADAFIKNGWVSP